MSSKADFSDLMPRLISAVVMVAVGAGSLWVGGDVFALVLIIAAGLMGWEMSRMHCVNHLVPMVFGLLISALTLCVMFLTLPWSIGSAVLVTGAALLGHQRRPVAVLVVGVVIVAACLGLEELRSGFGFAWALWLILVVVATDVGGYFAGKMIGGPKIWARISPKKTWSGTIGGWLLAAAVGYGFYVNGIGGTGMVIASVFVSIASQAGDMVESAIKRRAGIKDSSNLIPGHGGLLDRFDGWLGAGLLTTLYLLVTA